MKNTENTGIYGKLQKRRKLEIMKKTIIDNNIQTNAKIENSETCKTKNAKTCKTFNKCKKCQNKKCK